MELIEAIASSILPFIKLSAAFPRLCVIESDTAMPTASAKSGSISGDNCNNAAFIESLNFEFIPPAKLVLAQALTMFL